MNLLQGGVTSTTRYLQNKDDRHVKQLLVFAELEGAASISKVVQGKNLYRENQTL